MSEYIRFPYREQRRNFLDDTYEVITEQRVEINRIRQIIEDIHKQTIDLLRDGIDSSNFVCLINELDRIAIGVYFTQLMGNTGQGNIDILYTQAGAVNFYTANVTVPIVGYK